MIVVDTGKITQVLTRPFFIRYIKDHRYAVIGRTSKMSDCLTRWNDLFIFRICNFQDPDFLWLAGTDLDGSVRSEVSATWDVSQWELNIDRGLLSKENVSNLGILTFYECQ